MPQRLESTGTLCWYVASLGLCALVGPGGIHAAGIVDICMCIRAVCV